jgi:hypothetical protein
LLHEKSHVLTTGQTRIAIADITCCRRADRPIYDEQRSGQTRSQRDDIFASCVCVGAIEKEENEFACGAALGHPMGPRTQFLLEIYGATNSELGDNLLDLNIGADIALIPAWHLLLTVGTGLQEPTGAERLDYTGFLGIQYFTGMR